MTRWVMIADLERCVGCQTCAAACRHTNATSPAVQWRRVLDMEAGTFPHVSRAFVPIGCQHCEDPPCMHVCPSTATRQRADGIVTIDYDICIGCAYCDVACPYQARFKVDELRPAYGERAMPNEIEREDERLIGVAQKCTFCSDRIDFGVENGLVPGLDPRATPACVNACIADALHFGDIDDPHSNVSRLLREHKCFRMHEEIGTEPGFYYAYGKAGGADRPPAAAAGKVRFRGAEPARQPHWDWKAAANFMCGGTGTALFAFVALADPAEIDARLLAVAALGLVGLGLTLLLLKIGRPLRFIYVLRQPQRSWMSREAWVAAWFFPLALSALALADPTLYAAAAFVGLVFLGCQAMILREAKGIPVWREPRAGLLIVATGLAEGSGLFLTAATLLPSLTALRGPAAAAVIAFAAMRAVVWQAYLSALKRRGVSIRSLAILTPLRPWLLALGLLAPMVLIGIGFAAPGIQSVLWAAGGLSTFLAGWSLKYVLIARASYRQDFALKHLPERGAAVVAAPAFEPSGR